MLAFTPQVEHALLWFDKTHRWNGHTVEQHVEMPGGFGRQDAKMAAAMEVLRVVHTDMVKHA